MTMTRCIRIVCLLLMFLAVSQKVKASDKWGRQYLPNNPVVTQHGQHLQFYDNVLKNKIVVISFIYTSCRDICPIITARLSQLEEKLGDVVGRDIFFVSISIDPENDTPERIRTYLSHFDSHILGLTGTRDAIGSFSREIGAGSQAVGSGIDHSTSLFVLDPKGRLAGILLRPNDPARIVADLTTLRH